MLRDCKGGDAIRTKYEKDAIKMGGGSRKRKTQTDKNDPDFLPEIFGVI